MVKKYMIYAEMSYFLSFLLQVVRFLCGLSGLLLVGVSTFEQFCVWLFKLLSCWKTRITLRCVLGYVLPVRS